MYLYGAGGHSKVIVDILQRFGIRVKGGAVSMTICKKCRKMLPKIERVRGEQLCRTSEAQRLAWPGI